MTRALLMLSACLLASAPVGHAASILVSVAETEAGQPVPPPAPAAEGLMSALFDAGHIVLEARVPASAAAAALLSEASATESGFLIRVTVGYTRVRSEKGADRLGAKVSYTILDVESGKTLGTGTLSAGNEGREREVDLSALGSEIGAGIASASAEALRSGGQGR
jgi:hypothetical protein